MAACGFDGLGTGGALGTDARAADAAGGRSINEAEPPPLGEPVGPVVYVDAGDRLDAAPIDAGSLPSSPGLPLAYVVSTRFWTFDPVGRAWRGGTQLPANDCPMLDELAVDPYGALFAVGNGGANLYRVEPVTLRCTAIGAGGTYPQALTFAPRGTRNPYVEQLVGYRANGDYVRVDTANGALSLVTAGVFAGSTVGDLINVGSKGYVAFTGGACGPGDCLWEVSLATGDKIGAAPIGQLPTTNHVTALAHWGGKLYAFGAPDEAYVIDPSNPAAAVRLGGPPGYTNVGYRGAGSRTIAPPQ